MPRVLVRRENLATRRIVPAAASRARTAGGRCGGARVPGAGEPGSAGRAEPGDR
jgi:hypothetical protein